MNKCSAITCGAFFIHEMKTKLLLLTTIALLWATFSTTGQPLPTWTKKPQAEQIIRHEGFTVSYNNRTLCPNWVIWELSPEEASSNVTGRADFFTTDPDVTGRQAEYHDYSRNPYGMDRGHMAPSADFKWSVTANEQTFYLTNICPQAHGLNDGLWLELEQRCRAMVKRYKEPMTIVCGPIFTGEERNMGANGVSIPSAFFKAMKITIDGTDYACAFIMENKDINKYLDVFSFSVSSNELTALTGIIPFPGTGIEKNDNPSFPWNIPWKKPKN